MNRNSRQDITEGVIWKQLLIFFFPILLGSFFQQMYNTADTIIVGRAVGTQALAAVGATSPLISLINGFFIGLSSGATVTLSQFFGANDSGGVRRAMHTGMTLSVLLGFLTAIIGIGAGPEILRLTRTPENCLDEASRYVRIYFIGAVPSMVYNMGTGILRAMGDSRRPTVFLIISCFLNIGLDILFVAVWKMGVAGAAAATVLAQCISAVLVLWVLCRLPGEHRLRRNTLMLHGDLIVRILSIGIPAGLQLVTFDLSNLLLQSGINSFGEVTVAAWTALVKTDTLPWLVSGAFGVAVTTFVGQNFGARKYDRIHRSIWTCMGMSILAVGGISAAEVLFREFILGIYTADQEVIRTGARIMLLIVPFNILFMPVEVFSGAMRGTGYSLVPTLISCFCVCAVRVGWLLMVVSRWHSMEVLALSYPISWIVASVMFFVTYFRGTWLQRQIDAQDRCDYDPDAKQ